MRKMVMVRIRQDNITYSILSCKKGYYYTIRGKRVLFLGKDYSHAQDLFFSIMGIKE